MGKIIIPSLSFDSEIEFQDFVETEKEWMYDNILIAVKRAISTNLEIVDIAIVKIKQPPVNMTIQASRDEWVKALTLAMKYYTKTEQYEKCAEVRDILSIIK